MKRFMATLSAVTLAWTISAAAQTPQAQASAAAETAGKSAPLPKGTRVVAELKTKVDAKHTKSGDPIVVEVKNDVKAGDTVLLKKGSQIKGAVSQVTEPQGKSGAQLSIVFDTVIPKSGDQFPNHFGIYALAAKLEEQPGDIYASGGKQRIATSAGISGQVTAPHSDGGLNPQSSGIFGFDNVELHPLVSMTPPTATVNSRTGNIVLEKGTGLVLESVGQ